MNENKLKNLRPLGKNQLSPEEEFAIRSKGGKAASEAKKKRKALREMAAEIMEQKPILTPEQMQQMKTMGFDPDDIDLWTLCIVGLINATANGDSRAGQALLEYTGNDASTVNVSKRLQFERERLAFAREQAEYDRQEKQQAKDNNGQLDQLIAGLQELRK